MKFVENRTREFSGEVYSELGSSVVSIVLGSGSCGCSYGYRLYIVLKSDLSKHSLEEAARVIKKLYSPYRDFFYSGYFGWREYPIILQESIFSFLLDFRLFPDAMESFYLLKHGLVLKGKDVLQDTRAHVFNYNDAIILSSITPKLKEIRAVFMNATILKFHSDKKMSFYQSRAIIDACGAIPCAVLLLKFGIIATTPSEIVQEYCRNFSEDSSRDWLKDFFAKYGGLPAEEVRKFDPKHLVDESYCFLMEQAREINKLINTMCNVHFG